MSEPGAADRPTLAPLAAPALTQPEIDQRVFDLYDEYCHGGIDRREFLRRAGARTIGGVSALALAQTLLPRYARAQTISFTDPRIKALYVTYPSPGGTSGAMRGYLVQPSGPGPFPAVLVIQRAVAGLRGRAEGGRHRVRGPRLSRYPARLSQQLDAALRRGRGPARLAADDRLLQEAARLITARPPPDRAGWGARRARGNR
jgi:hypothetical protein